jgi:hypothetical protein
MDAPGAATPTGVDGADGEGSLAGGGIPGHVVGLAVVPGARHHDRTAGNDVAYRVLQLVRAGVAQRRHAERHVDHLGAVRRGPPDGLDEILHQA